MKISCTGSFYFQCKSTEDMGKLAAQVHFIFAKR